MPIAVARPTAPIATGAMNTAFVDGEAQSEQPRAIAARQFNEEQYA
jgi:hypothetical protein